MYSIVSLNQVLYLECYITNDQQDLGLQDLYKANQVLDSINSQTLEATSMALELNVDPNSSDYLLHKLDHLVQANVPSNSLSTDYNSSTPTLDAFAHNKDYIVHITMKLEFIFLN